jgi:hypothetical protein
MDVDAFSNGEKSSLTSLSSELLAIIGEWSDLEGIQNLIVCGNRRLTAKLSDPSVHLSLNAAASRSGIEPIWSASILRSFNGLRSIALRVHSLGSTFPSVKWMSLLPKALTSLTLLGSGSAYLLLPGKMTEGNITDKHYIPINQLFPELSSLILNGSSILDGTLIKTHFLPPSLTKLKLTTLPHDDGMVLDDSTSFPSGLLHLKWPNTECKGSLAWLRSLSSLESLSMPYLSEWRDWKEVPKFFLPSLSKISLPNLVYFDAFNTATFKHLGIFLAASAPNLTSLRTNPIKALDLPDLLNLKSLTYYNDDDEDYHRFSAFPAHLTHLDLREVKISLWDDVQSMLIMPAGLQVLVLPDCPIALRLESALPHLPRSLTHLYFWKVSYELRDLALIVEHLPELRHIGNISLGPRVYRQDPKPLTLPNSAEMKHLMFWSTELPLLALTGPYTGKEMQAWVFRFPDALPSYPGLDHDTPNGWITWKSACALGRIDLLSEMLTMLPKFADVPYPKALLEIVRVATLPVIDWLVLRRIGPFDSVRNLQIRTLAGYAIQTHRLELLQHLEAHYGFSVLDIDGIMSIAADQKVPTAILQWLQDQGAQLPDPEPWKSNFIPILNQAFSAGWDRSTIKWLVDQGRVQINLKPLIEILRSEFLHEPNFIFDGLRNLAKAIPKDTDDEEWWKETFSKIELRYMGKPMSTETWHQVLLLVVPKYGEWPWEDWMFRKILKFLSALGLSPTPSQTSPFKELEPVVRRRSQRLANTREDRSFQYEPARILCDTRWPFYAEPLQDNPSYQWACWMIQNDFPFSPPPGTKGEQNFTHRLIRTQGREQPKVLDYLFEVKKLDLDALDMGGHSVLEVTRWDRADRPLAELLQIRFDGFREADSDSASQ